ncbi:unnamed protein product [Thelazia callipaeda]|uniref:Nematode cuticle collagen N-terminal domain-containing protein n=1 Tax=Thelazia callipaeda TaxID=103827 RepID=A0A0N5D4Z1_THECL|nr:unnamed protein product [Thelazia callipaeda]
MIISFGPFGIFIPQFYFLQNLFFSCCPLETTIAYTKILQRAAQKKILCSKVSTTTALIITFTSFVFAALCTSLAISFRQVLPWYKHLWTVIRESYEEVIITNHKNH